jgi:glycosyltransferase involved in cell wall biosynthesis
MSTLRLKSKKDLSYLIFNNKKKVFKDLKRITIIGLSKWLYSSSKSSELFKDKRHVNLPNMIDIELYRPIDKDIERKKWGLSGDKKLILFGADSTTSDPRKGFSKLLASLKLMDIDDVELVVFGNDEPEEKMDVDFEVNYVGRLTKENELVSIYNTADVMIVPSLEENLSNTIMESLSCGVPVVAFDIGGNKDMIEHKKNGVLGSSF